MGTQDPGSPPTSTLCDMPEPWLKSLLRKRLKSRDRLHLFQGSKDLSAAVLRHTEHLQLLLQPGIPQQQALANGSNSRQSVLSAILAAASDCDIHVVLQHGVSVLWHSAVLPKSHITKVTLQGMIVTDALLMSLQLQQCQQLHTLCICSGCTTPLSADTATARAAQWQRQQQVQKALATLQVQQQQGQKQVQQESRQAHWATCSWLPPSLRCLDVSGCIDALFFDVEHLVPLLEPYIRELRLQSLTDRLFDGLKKQQQKAAVSQQHLAQGQGRKSVLDLVTARTLKLHRDHSQQDVIRWQQLEVTQATRSCQLAQLPLRHIKQLKVHEGMLAGEQSFEDPTRMFGHMSADEALEVRLKASGTQLVCVPQWCKELGQPVFSLHGPCLASLAGLCAGNLARTCGLHIDDVSPEYEQLLLRIKEFPPQVNLLSIHGMREALLMQFNEAMFQPLVDALPQTITRVAYYPTQFCTWQHIRALAMALASSPTHSHVAIIVVLPETEGLTEHQLQQALEGCPRVSIVRGKAQIKS